VLFGPLRGGLKSGPEPVEVWIVDEPFEDHAHILENLEEDKLAYRLLLER